MTANAENLFEAGLKGNFVILLIFYYFIKIFFVFKPVQQRPTLKINL